MPRSSDCHSLVLKCATMLSLICTNTSLFALDLDATKIRGETHAEPVTVLQNRYFFKAWRPEFGLLGGSMLNEAYTNTTLFGFRAGMFISEWLGFEYQNVKAKVKNSDDRKALNTLKYRPLDISGENANKIVTADAEVNSIHSFNDVNLIFAPFYGKLNLFDRYIIYSDLYITAGVSRVETDQGIHSAFTWGAGQRFYFSEHWSTRIDFKDRIYEELRANKESQKNAYSVDVSASYFFL